MNYYDKIKNELINNEMNRKVKNIQLTEVIQIRIIMLVKC